MSNKEAWQTPVLKTLGSVDKLTQAEVVQAGIVQLVDFSIGS